MTRGEKLIRFKELLRKNGKNMRDVDRIFKQKKKELNREKRYATYTEPYGEKSKYPLGRFVTKKDSAFPFAMHVLQEIYVQPKEEPEIRLGYYIVSWKDLENGKLRLMWGQRSPTMPKEDLMDIVQRAKTKGIL